MVVAETRAGTVPTTLAWDYSDSLELEGFTYAGATQSYTYDEDGLIATAAPFAIARDAQTAMPTTVTAPGFALGRTYTDYGELEGTSMELAPAPATASTSSVTSRAASPERPRRSRARPMCSTTSTTCSAG